MGIDNDALAALDQVELRLGEVEERLLNGLLRVLLGLHFNPPLWVTAMCTPEPYLALAYNSSSYRCLWSGVMTNSTFDYFIRNY